MKRFILACALFLAAFSAAWSGSSDDCSCRNLESLQQEVENAEYEAKFFAEMAGALKAIEDAQIAINKDPTNADSGKDVLALSGQARIDYMAKNFHLPHPQVKDSSGPDSVDMPFGTCSQRSADLDALAKGAACRSIGDIVLKHEADHRSECEKQGAKAYWLRLPSLLAAEEAQRYADQAKAMRDLLKMVIDAGTFRVRAIMEPRIRGQGFDVTYSYVTDPADLEGKSSPGSDRWTVNGEGHRVGTIKTIKLAGMSCKGSGQLNDAVTYTLDTNGFDIGLKEHTQAQAGKVKVTCKKGYGMSMQAPSDEGSGQVFTKQPLKLQSTVVQNLADMNFAKILSSGGLSVSGTEEVTVELVCPGN